MLAEKPSIGVFTPARGEPTTLADVFDAAVESAHDVSNWGAMRQLEETAYDRRIDAIKAAIGIELQNPYRIPPNPRAGHFGELQENLRDPHVDFQSELQRLAEQFPDHVDAIRPQRSPREEAAERANRTEKKFQDVFARAPAGWRWGAAFSGAFTGSLSDPGNVAAMALGPVGRVGVGAASVMWMGVKQAVANMAVETFQQPAIQHWRARAGLEHGLGHAAGDIAMAGAFGFAADAGVRSAFRGAQRFRGRVPELDEAGNIVRWRRPDEALDDAARRLGRTSTVRKAAEGDLKALDRLARETGAADDPAVQGAREAARIEEEIGRPPPPLTDRADGLSTLAQALRAAEDPVEPPPMRPDPTPQATARNLADDAPAPPARFRMDGKPVTTREVQAAELVTDAATFQFKAGGDAEGATGRLAGVRQWDPLAAGRVIVFERADGTLVIADGHQRLALARRLEADGHEAIGLQAVVFREAEGWTPSDVRALAARKNLQEGSGTVIDAARAIRERPGILDSSVPLGTEAMRQARALARLSDEALAAVINGEIAPNHAAVVGDLVRDRSQHAGLIRRLIEAEPNNVREARHMVADLMQIGARAEAQRTILGGDRRALLPERARVLDRAMRLFREDARIFALISREARRIEQAGNQLAIDSNADRALTGEAVVALMEDLAVRSGPVSDLLDEAARALQSGTKVKQAAEEFVDAVRAMVERDGLAGLVPHEQPLRGAHGIDAPGGPEAKAQVTALERELGARIDRALEAAAERAIDKWAAWSRANGRPLPEINPMARAVAVRLIRSGTAVGDAVDRAILDAAAAAREAETPRPPVDPLAELTPEERQSVADTWRFVQEMRRAKPPQRLVDFLRERGGLKDDGGDVRHMIGGVRSRPGLINNRRGMELDEATHLAWEQGFLETDTRPEINDLLSAIDADIRGTMVVRQSDREALESFQLAQQMEADLGRLGLDDAKTEAELRQRLGGDTPAEGREGLGGDQARAGGPEGEASLDEPPFAVGELDARADFDLQIARGERVEVDASVVDGARAAIEPAQELVPAGWSVGIFQRAEPLGDGRVKARFVTPEGKGFTLTAPWPALRGKRGTLFSGGRAILLFRFGARPGEKLVGDVAGDALEGPLVGKVSQVLVGTLLHEITHVRLRDLPRVAARLVSHAERLRVLDMTWNDFARATGQDDLVAPVAGQQTLRQIYEAQYSTRPDRDALVDEEAVTHLVELIHHGAVAPSKVAPIRPLLDQLLDADGGDLIGRRLAANENAPAFAMAGPLARNADLVRLEAAQVMEQAGRTAEEIWQATGWFRGAEGFWRFEIPDRDARLKGEADRIAKGQSDSRTIEGRADEILDHPLLWEAYPELRRVTVRLEHSRSQPRRGAAFEDPRAIEVRAASARQSRLVLLHELQHLIQRRENFARGGSPATMGFWVRKALSDLDQEAAHVAEQLEALEATIAPFDPANANHWRATLLERLGTLLAERDRLDQTRLKILYLKLAGEVEARNVERRSQMRRPERLAASPEATEDVPRPEQIVLREPAQRPFPALSEDWERALWEEMAQRAHRIERDVEKKGQRAVRSQPKSAAELEAEAFAKRVRDHERKLMDEGRTPVEIAADLSRTFEMTVRPEDVASRMVWWEIGRRGRGPKPKRPARPRETAPPGLASPEARGEIERMMKAGMLYRAMAERMSDLVGAPVSPRMIENVANRFGLAKRAQQQPARGAWPPDALALLTSPDIEGLSYKQIADLLTERTGNVYTRGAVAGKLQRLRDELDEAERAGTLKDTVESCKL